MTLPAELTLVEATPDDLPEIGRLRLAAGWNVHDWALRAVIGQPDACCVLVRDVDGTVVGVGSGIAYGPLGFVGNMVVAEMHRRRGVGSEVLTAVTEFLERAGCRRLELNATSEGRRLYERHGFASTGVTTIAGVPRDRVMATDEPIDVRPARAGELDAVAAYDRPRFGGERRRILELLLADPSAVVLVAEAHGRMAGYALLWAGPARVGPMQADEPAVAAALLTAAFGGWPDLAELRLFVPPPNAAGAAWLRASSLVTESYEGRMARGEPLPGRDEASYAMTVGALG